MSKYDDGSKLAKPMTTKQKTARYKKSPKNAVISEGHDIPARKSAFQMTEFGINPERAAMKAEQRPRKAKKESKVDPFMVRQAKLKAKQQA
jgi:hypothetical protein